MSGARRPSRGARVGHSSVQPARRIAFDVISAVRESDAYANLLLPARIAAAGLDERDAALATELTHGTLRMRGYYDRVIAIAAKRDTSAIEPVVLDVLRLGVHQLLGMRVAPHAAVDESVELTRHVASRGASAFVNAVLRTVTREPAESWRARAVRGRTGDAALAIQHSHPDWVVGALRDALDAEGRGEELPALLEADNLPPRVSLVALPGHAVPSEVGEPGSLSPVAAVASGGDPARIPAVATGTARVQDEGSQLAALALSRAREISPGERWLDMCAGPGGKAALLAAEAAQGGAQLVANEVSAARAGLVRTALRATAPETHVWELDGTTIGAEHPRVFDRILLDAPCTGLGALRRRPEARWRKTPADVAELAALQTELLASALAALAPGGLLAYVTCSPHLDETVRVLDAVLAERPDVERLDTPAVLATIATRELELPDAPHAQLWPHRHGTDAMFIQLLTRR